MAKKANKVSTLKVGKKAKTAIKSVGIKKTKEQLIQRVGELVTDRQKIGNRLVDLIEKANRLAAAHQECKEQMRVSELDLLAVGKEIRAAKSAAEAA